MYFSFKLIHRGNSSVQDLAQRKGAKNQEFVHKGADTIIAYDKQARRIIMNAVRELESLTYAFYKLRMQKRKWKMTRTDSRERCKGTV